MATKKKQEETGERLGVWSVTPIQPWMEAWLGLWSNEGAAQSAWPWSVWSLTPPTQSGGAAEGAKAAQPTPMAPGHAGAWLEMWPIGLWSAGAGRAPQNPVETWLSFTPAAPFFGLRWAFFEASGAESEGAPRAAKEEKLVLTGQARRERAALNRRVVGRAVDPAPAATETTAPETEEARKPRLRVVDGGAKAKSAAAKEAEKLAATSKSAATRAPAPKPAKPDDLTAIKGVGAKLAALLNDLGVRRFEELAKMSAADFEALDEKLGTFRGRWKRDDWAGQAAKLAKARR